MLVQNIMKDGTTLFGQAYDISLQRLVERIDEEYPQLINEELIQMDETYTDAMTDCTIPNLKKAID